MSVGFWPSKKRKTGNQRTVKTPENNNLHVLTHCTCSPPLRNTRVVWACCVTAPLTGGRKCDQVTSFSRLATWTRWQITNSNLRWLFPLLSERVLHLLWLWCDGWTELGFKHTVNRGDFRSLTFLVNRRGIPHSKPFNIRRPNLVLDRKLEGHCLKLRSTFTRSLVFAFHPL